jgi:hypothetical protein
MKSTTSTLPSCSAMRSAWPTVFSVTFEQVAVERQARLRGLREGDALCTAARASAVIVEVDPEFFVRAVHESRQHAHTVPQERRVVRMMDVGFDGRAISSNLVAALESRMDRQR